MGRDWNSIMFDDIGIKIQKVAKALAWVDIVLSIISGIVMFFCAFINFKYLWYLIFLAPISVVAGCITAWLSVITLYGFGKLIEDVAAIRKKDRAPQNTVSESNSVSELFVKAKAPSQVHKDSSTTSRKWRCEGCGKMRTQSPCEHCGKA